MTSVSIVTPCRNGEAFLAATLRSALNQTEPPLEIIVIDDGSTDKSRAIAESFGARVKVHAGTAKGAAIARNTGASLARGDRIMFLDADDLLTPGTLAALGRALDEAPAEAVALCPWDRLEAASDAPLTPWYIKPASNALPRPGQDALANWLTGTWSPPCCVLWTKEGFAASGGWLQEAGLDDDGNLLRRALARGVTRVWASDGLALYRRLPGEMVSYSGRRLQPFGLRARLNSLSDTLDALGNQAAKYRSAFMTSALELRRDAAKHPEFAGEIQAMIDRAGGARPWDGLKEAVGQLGARAMAWRNERTTPIVETKIYAMDDTPEPVTSGPRVSVIIPTFNRSNMVRNAAQSALDQTYETTEIIVVDDGSTDDTAGVLATLTDPRLRVITQVNRGVARARNAGIEAAKGEYLAFLDADDLWRPEKLAKQVALMEAAPARTGYCYTAVDIMKDGTTIETRRARYTGSCLPVLLLTNPIHAPLSSGLVRREVFDAIGGFDPDMPSMEDWEWIQRLARLYDITAVDEPLTIYNDHETDDRRSRAFRRNMDALAMLWTRNAHALRRVGAAHLYLLECARRELREDQGNPVKGRAIVRRMLSERPQIWRNWMWLPYMLAPFSLRAKLREIDAPRYERKQARQT